MIELEREGRVVGRDREIALRDERAAEPLGLPLDDGDHGNLRGADVGIDIEDRLGDGGADAGGGRVSFPADRAGGRGRNFAVGADEDDLVPPPGGKLSDRPAHERQLGSEQAVLLSPRLSRSVATCRAASSSIRKASVSMNSPAV